MVKGKRSLEKILARYGPERRSISLLIYQRRSKLRHILKEKESKGDVWRSRKKIDERKREERPRGGEINSRVKYEPIERGGIKFSKVTFGGKSSHHLIMIRGPRGMPSMELFKKLT